MGVRHHLKVPIRCFMHQNVYFLVTWVNFGVSYFQINGGKSETCERRALRLVCCYCQEVAITTIPFSSNLARFIITLISWSLFLDPTQMTEGGTEREVEGGGGGLPFLGSNKKQTSPNFLLKGN